MDGQQDLAHAVEALEAELASLKDENERLEWMLWQAARYAAWAWREQMRMIGLSGQSPQHTAARDDPEVWIREWEDEWSRPFADAEHHRPAG